MRRSTPFAKVVCDTLEVLRQRRGAPELELAKALDDKGLDLQFLEWHHNEDVLKVDGLWFTVTKEAKNGPLPGS